MNVKYPIALILFILLAASPLRSQYKLEETLSAPYTESVTGSEDGQSIAWVVDNGGKRNIWYAETGNSTPRQITDYNLDDGQEISNISIASGYIIYIRGGNSNRYGDIPNPMSLPTLPKREIFRARISDKKIDKIDEAFSPVIAPDGKRMLFIKQSKVWIIDDITADEVKSRVLFEVRRGAGTLRWSPDGNNVAFVSGRADHSFVGYYSIPENQVHWMAPSLDRDDEPVWSPDGSQMAFIRISGEGQGELINIMSGWAFSIVVADTKTGNGSVIWSSPSDDGGFAQYYPNAPLRWTAENKILFYSEHEGWLHIYSISPDGSGVKSLTPGPCEVENSSLSQDQKTLYYSSNCGDINGRNIWKVQVGSGQSQMLTEKSTFDTDPVALSGDAVAYRESSYNLPTTVILKKGSSVKNLVTLPSNFPADKLIKPQVVEFKSADGLTIYGQLFIPANYKSSQKLPALIFMHGGPIRQMLPGFHYSHYYANAYALNQYLTTQGFVVLSVNYRDGIGYGKDFRRARNQGPRGASEYQDIIAAGKYLQSRPEVNPEKLGLWGGSYGGYLTAMGLAKNSDMFKAGVDLHGVHDWSWRARDFSPGGAWGITEDLMDEAYHSSPISELQFWSSPVLLIHGDDDRNVMFGQSIDLKKKLDALGVHNEVLVFPDEVHGFLRYGSWYKAYLAATDFFNRFLK